MEYPASWNIDSRKDNTIKSFCCLNARARDFAKFGRLYLNDGNWNGKQIVPVEWVKRSETVMNEFPRRTKLPLYLPVAGYRLRCYFCQRLAGTIHMGKSFQKTHHGQD